MWRNTLSKSVAHDLVVILPNLCIRVYMFVWFACENDPKKKDNFKKSLL